LLALTDYFKHLERESESSIYMENIININGMCSKS
jgi:hypothetical protein